MSISPDHSPSSNMLATMSPSLSHVRFSPGFLFPLAANIPLSTFILHQDAKLHQKIEFHRQNIELAGHFDDLEWVVQSGFDNMKESLEGVSDAIFRLDETIGEGFFRVYEGLFRVNESLREIEFTLDRLNSTTASGFDTICSGLTRIALGIESINQAAWNPEFAWSTEQSAFAFQAFAVRDLRTAKQRIDYAISGHGSHSGTPTHPPFYLQKAEILNAFGNNTHRVQALQALTQVKPYVDAYGNNLTAARWHFAAGNSHYHKFFESQDIEDIKRAQMYFEQAENESSFFADARILRIHATYAAWKLDQTKELCVDLLTKRPRAFLSLTKTIQHNKFNRRFLRDCVEKAASNIFGGGAEIEELKQKQLALKDLRRAINCSTKFGYPLTSQLHSIESLENRISTFVKKLVDLRNSGTFFRAIRYASLRGTLEEIRTISSSIRNDVESATQ